VISGKQRRDDRSEVSCPGRHWPVAPCLKRGPGWIRGESPPSRPNAGPCWPSLYLDLKILRVGAGRDVVPNASLSTQFLCNRHKGWSDISRQTSDVSCQQTYHRGRVVFGGHARANRLEGFAVANPPVHRRIRSVPEKWGIDEVGGWEPDRRRHPGAASGSPTV